MRNLLIFLGVLMALGVLAEAMPHSQGSPTKDINPKDWFEEVIKATIGMSVRELLILTQATFWDLNLITDSGLKKLTDVYTRASPTVKAELEVIEGEVRNQTSIIVAKLLEDLGKVLPSLSSASNSTENDDKSKSPIGQFSAADIILAILGVTLEAFVTIIRDTLVDCANLLTDTMLKFQDLQQIANPEVASGLREISDSYLMQGKTVVMPVLDKLNQIV